MIIPGNALPALLSPPQESQGTREEEGGFGTLLAEIEQHTTSLPDLTITHNFRALRERPKVQGVDNKKGVADNQL